MTDNKIPKISIGIISMTVILCVLCLTVFSVLALSTAISERNFARKRAQVTQEYYAAEREATKLVNDLQKTIGNDAGMQTLIDQNEITVEDEIFRFQKSIDDGQELKVELHMNEKHEKLQIEVWQVVSTADWIPDDSLRIWDGDMLIEE